MLAPDTLNEAITRTGARVLHRGEYTIVRVVHHRATRRRCRRHSRVLVHGEPVRVVTWAVYDKHGKLDAWRCLLREADSYVSDVR